jgi:hypothetical protein
VLFFAVTQEGTDQDSGSNTPLLLRLETADGTACLFSMLQTELALERVKVLEWLKAAQQNQIAIEKEQLRSMLKRIKEVRLGSIQCGTCPGGCGSMLNSHRAGSIVKVTQHFQLQGNLCSFLQVAKGLSTSWPNCCSRP